MISKKKIISYKKLERLRQKNKYFLQTLGYTSMKIMKKYIIKEKVIIITNFNYFATDKIKKILFHISNRDNILLKNY